MSRRCNCRDRPRHIDGSIAKNASVSGDRANIVLPDNAIGQQYYILPLNSHDARPTDGR
jgi:hypothetical protein